MSDISGPSRAAAFAYVGVAYLVATAAAFAVARTLALPTIWGTVAAADAAATLVVFVFSALYDNSSVYDAYWSVAPMVIAPALAWGNAASRAPLLRRAVVVVVVLLWGARLTWNWARGWRGRGHEDWRYVDLREKTGRLYWIVSLLGLHLMPTLSVFLGCLALVPALRWGTHPIGPLDAVALGVTAGAIALEATADEQLRAFRRADPESRALMTHGLWKVSRHPNYLGEIGFWWGLALFGIAADASSWWVLVGPAWITGLFVFVSIPMMERRQAARRPGYAEWKTRVPALLPLRVRRRSLS